MTDTQPGLPPAADFALTHRLPCAALAVGTFTAVLWLPALGGGVPVVAVLLATLAAAAHLLTPALFAVVSLGGGMGYALQVGALAAAGVVAASGFSLLPGMLMLALYAVVPAFAAFALQRPDGLARSGHHLALAMTGAVVAALLFGAQNAGVAPSEFVGELVAPMFDRMEAELPPGANAAASLETLRKLRETTVAALPGTTILGLWLTWWSAVLLGRFVAVRYGFYRGDARPLLEVRFAPAVAYIFAALLLIGLVSGGEAGYMANNLALVPMGMLAVQGIAVAHSWLRARGMQIAIVAMYLILLMWSATVLAFAVVGILDIWFDYRRNIVPRSGGE